MKTLPSISSELKKVLKKLKLGPIIATPPDRIALAEMQKLSLEELLVLSDEIARIRCTSPALLAGDLSPHALAHERRGDLDEASVGVEGQREPSTTYSEGRGHSASALRYWAKRLERESGARQRARERRPGASRAPRAR
ncbi:Hypothetical protein I5071_730 (plasmid) [Sandaracinus amylolyticus]|uniref:hypothetical protein n=1 Tax=Sandaracinus sp. TaxID=2024858 RepID=UPI0019D4DD76|nr:hypothetical protein [Sandaracinus sp.]UJR87281.1 Hypothetical protein I5071_730 [Sandaracinus amylolyticus]